jgi:crotonobetainyl-CoA:carnitine CoA-transferase CaiB-like acyl-CoA transferase
VKRATGVMAGIRILEVAEHTFVPAASAILSDWGAEVIKVEPTGRGDAMRALARTGVVDLGSGGVHALLEHSNRGKQSIGLDLTTAEGREVLYKLAGVCDVFLTNKLPRIRRDLAIDVEDIRAHNPNIIYVRGSGYGQEGPDADQGGYDTLGYWCRSGVGSGVQPPDVDGFIGQPGPAYGDSIGAMTIAGGISAALLHRERTGEVTVVDVSLLGTGMWAGGAGMALALQMGHPWAQQPLKRTQLNNPLVSAYETKDGRWLNLCCLQAFRYWPDACALVGREDLIADARFATHEDLTANALEASHILADEFAGRTGAEWRERLVGFSGQWSFVQDAIEVSQDPQVLANGYLVETATADGTPFSLVAAPVQFDGRSAPTARAPQFNEHGDRILTELLGYDWDSVVDMKLKGAVE